MQTMWIALRFLLGGTGVVLVSFAGFKAWRTDKEGGIVPSSLKVLIGVGCGLVLLGEGISWLLGG